MRKFLGVLVVVAMCICLVVPAFAAEDLDSLSSLFEGVDVASMSDTELAAVLGGLNLEGFDLNSIRSAIESSDAEKENSINDLKDSLGSLASGDADALSGFSEAVGSLAGGDTGSALPDSSLSGLTDSLGSLTDGIGGSALPDSAFSGISDAIGSITGGSTSSESAIAGLSDLFGGMDMSWLTNVVSDPSSLFTMFSSASDNGAAADESAEAPAGEDAGDAGSDAGEAASGGFDLGAIKDMISGAFGGAGFDIGSLIGGVDLGSFDIAKVLSGAGDLGSLLGGGDTAGKISDAVASISDMLKSGLEQLGMDPSIIDKLFDNDIVNFFANLFIGLEQMISGGGGGGLPSLPSSLPSSIPSSTPPASEPSAPATPNTGDSAAVFVAFGTLCAASAAAFVCLKKRKA